MSTTSIPAQSSTVTQAPGLSATWTDPTGTALTAPDGSAVDIGGGGNSTIIPVAPLSGGGPVHGDVSITTLMNTGKLIGRGTAGQGVMEEITLGSNLSMTGTTLNASGSGISTAIFFDAGTNTDLTDLIAEVVALAAPCVVWFRGLEYVWPAGTLWPETMSAIGQGWDSNSTPSAVGTRILSSDGTIIQSAKGVAYSPYVQGIYFSNGFQTRKQDMTFMSCRFDTLGTNGGLFGFIFGDNGDTVSDFYSQTIACMHYAKSGGTAISFQNNANACKVISGKGFLPTSGRLVDYNASAVGNQVEISLDRPGGFGSGVSYGAVVLYSTGSPSCNKTHFTYWDDTSFSGTYLDGGDIITQVTGATKNVVEIQSANAGQIRVYDYQGKNSVKITNLQDVAFQNSSFDWTLGFPRKIQGGTLSGGFFLPPVTQCTDTLTMLPTVTACTANSAWEMTASPTINAAGSGGTDGTYIQKFTDANTVTNMYASYLITVSGGVITAVSLLFPGWFRLQPATTLAVTAVTGLTGGIINTPSITDDLKVPGSAASWVLPEFTPVAFAPVVSGNDWNPFPRSSTNQGTASLSPNGSGLATIAHTRGRNLAWANVQAQGIAGGTDVTARLNAKDSTNITVLFATAAGTPVTTGTYSTDWQCGT